MLLTGREVRVDEAMAIGLADRRAAAGEALDTARALAEAIVSHPPLAMRADRASAWAAFDGSEAEALRAEATRAETAKHAEARAGASRFSAGAGRGGSFKAD